MKFRNVLFYNKYRNVLIQETKRYAGHSKWQNIKATKQENDRARSQVFNNLSHKMKVVAVETGNPDPNTNQKLANLVEQARKANMPMSTLKGILEKIKNVQTGETHILPMRIMKGPAFAIHIVTDKFIHVKFNILHISKKFNIRIIESSAFSHLFDCVTFVVASKDCNLDSALEDAITANATDVEETKDEHGTYFKSNRETRTDTGSPSETRAREEMDAIKPGWFSEINEDLWPGVSLSLEVLDTIHRERSEYQEVMVIDTKSHGRTLILDGIIQCTEKDEFSYQEMIAFLPLCSHPNPKTVLIVGGGDGGVAREVAKHPLVERIVQVEIDPKVLEVSRKYLPTMGVGLDHPKVTLNVGDGFQFLQQHSGAFDVIITDSSDPIGPAECLFHKSYFNLMKSALKPGGIVCSQAGTAWLNLSHVTQTLQHCKCLFPVASYGVVSVPTYPTGQIGFVLGGLNPETDFKEPKKVFSHSELDEMKMKYYDEDVHRAAFVLPRFITKALNEALAV